MAEQLIEKQKINEVPELNSLPKGSYLLCVDQDKAYKIKKLNLMELASENEDGLLSKDMVKKRIKIQPEETLNLELGGGTGGLLFLYQEGGGNSMLILFDYSENFTQIGQDFRLTEITKKRGQSIEITNKMANTQFFKIKYLTAQ